MPRPPWGPRPGGNCDYADDADYAAADYDAPDADYDDASPGVPSALAKCGTAARALEVGCEDAFVKVARGVRRGDIARDDAAKKFAYVARRCEAELNALAEKCADALTPPSAESPPDDDDFSRLNGEANVRAECATAVADVSMSCVDEPGGVLRALEAGETDDETAARTLGASAVACADAAAAAESACAEKDAAR